MISTQVIDTAYGRPAANVPVVLDYFVADQGWLESGRGTTDEDGIVAEFGENPAPGVYRLTFDIAAYQPDPFFPAVNVTFEVSFAGDDCHLSLHIGAYGYSVTRG